MEYCRVLLLFVFTGLCAGQLDVRILGSTRRMQQPGTSMNLTCELNQGLAVILDYTIEWVHVSLANRTESEEHVLSTQQTLSDKASPSEYGIDVSYTMTHCLFTLVVKRVKPKSDGIFRCRVTRNKDSHRYQKDAHVIVPNNVERVGLEFDGEDAIIGETPAPLTLEEGRYGVTCRAQGFNPSAVLHLFLENQEQETGGTEIDWDSRGSAKAGARRYTARAMAADVDLRAEHSGRRLRCVAQADFDGARVVESSVPLSIIAREVEPVVTCDKNASARPGDLYVKIECRVQHDNIRIDRYSWEIGTTGEVVVPQVVGKNYHEVIVDKVDERTTIVTLDLYQVDEKHFETVYYLDIFTASGQQFRTEAALIRLDPHPNSSTKTSAVFLICWLSVMLSFFNCC